MVTYRPIDSRGMARSSKSEQETRLLELLNSPVNRNKCGECKTNDPTWASWNLGIFLCGRCASAHRSLGQDISRVKSLSMENWSNYELKILSKGGNKLNNKFWNEKQIPFPYDPDDKDSLIMYLRDKYTGKFRYGAITRKDYNLDDDWGDRTDDYGFERSNRSRSSSNLTRRASNALGLNYVGQNRLKEQQRRNDDDYSDDNRNYDDRSAMTRSMRKGIERNSPMYNGDSYYNNRPTYSSRSYSSNSNLSSQASKSLRLTFRRPTDSEYRRYGDQSRKMKFDMGFENEDINIEALALTHGNINRAVELIKESEVTSKNKRDSRQNLSRNSTSSNMTPSLPQRKQDTGAIFDSSKAGGFNWLDDELSASSNATGSNISKTDNQIYQYVDPNTGGIYYIDANGQQYMDPTQQQQQQQQQLQLQGQQMNVLQTQQTSAPQNVMMTGFQQQQPFQQSFQQPFQQQTGQQNLGIATNMPPNNGLTLNQLAQQQQLVQQQQLQQQLQQQQQQQQQLLQQQAQFQQQQPGFFTGF